MKQFSIILNIILLAAVAVLFVLFFTSKPKAAATTEIQQTSQTQARKGDIVYIKLDTLINQYYMYNDLRSEFDSKLSAIDNDLSKQGRALENDAKSFQEKYQKGLLTRSQAETMGNDLAQREQELRNLTQQKQMEMAEEESVMFNNIMYAITSYIKEYNKTKQYSLILTTTAATNTVLDGDPGLDITDEVLAGLNAEYIKERNKK